MVSSWLLVIVAVIGVIGIFAADHEGYRQGEQVGWYAGYAEALSDLADEIVREDRGDS